MRIKFNFITQKFSHHFVDVDGDKHNFKLEIFTKIKVELVELLSRLYINVVLNYSLIGLLDRPWVVASSKTCGHPRSSMCRRR